MNDAPHLRKCEGLAGHDFWPQCRKAVMKWGAVKIFLFAIKSMVDRSVWNLYDNFNLKMKSDERKKVMFLR